MVEPTNAEKELRQAAKVEQRDDQNRQDFLATLTRAVSKLSDDDIDQLSSGAQDWYDTAVDAVNNKTTIPEIGDEGPLYDNVPTESASDDTAESQDEAGGEGDEQSATAEPEAEPAKANGSAEQTDLEDATKAADAEQAADATEATEQPAKANAKGTKASGKSKASSGAKKAPTAKGKSQAKAKGAESKASKAKGENKQTKKQPSGGNKDKFGCVVGSRRSQAAALFEQGMTMREVRDKFDGNLTFYNLLNKLKESGHDVDRQEGGKIKLTHKDEA